MTETFREACFDDADLRCFQLTFDNEIHGQAIDLLLHDLILANDVDRSEHF